MIQEIRKELDVAIKSRKTKVKSEVNKNEICSLDFASEKEESSWFSVIPLKRYNFDLTKSDFRDVLSLRYGWDPVKMPLL